MQPGRDRNLVTASLMLCNALAALEATAVAAAVPTAVGELGGMARYSWVFSAYLLTSTTTVPLYGKLADLYGRRRIFHVAVALFLLGSALSGAAHSFDQLIVCRALQGLGAGGVQPIAITIVGDIFTLEERGRIQGLFSGVWAAASLLGPPLGGLITDALLLALDLLPQPAAGARLRAHPGALPARGRGRGAGIAAPRHPGHPGAHRSGHRPARGAARRQPVGWLRRSSRSLVVRRGSLRPRAVRLAGAAGAGPDAASRAVPRSPDRVSSGINVVIGTLMFSITAFVPMCEPGSAGRLGGRRRHGAHADAVRLADRLDHLRQAAAAHRLPAAGDLRRPGGRSVAACSWSMPAGWRCAPR